MKRKIKIELNGVLEERDKDFLITIPFQNKCYLVLDGNTTTA